MNDTKVIEILKTLITIPSWVDEQTDEALIGEYIYGFLVKNTQLQVTKQFVEGKRFNILAQNSAVVDTLLVGHIDTVQPSLSWTKNPLVPEIDNDKLYGLGASDMKNGVAIMLALATLDLKPKTGFLFYVDEEYGFAGMKQFVQKYKGKFLPKQVISLDGSDLSIGNGCRGLIEVSCIVRGQSGHAARPTSGVNAINTSFAAIDKLSAWLKNFTSPILGDTTLNLAYINGGQYQGKEGDGLVLGKQGNVIPDICQFTLDIRPAEPTLNAQSVIDFLQIEVEKAGGKLVDSKITHNLGSWLTSVTDLSVDILGLPLGQASTTGYIDLQMIWSTFNKIPCFTVGAAEKGTPHKPDEYVCISKVNKLYQLMQQFLAEK